MLSKKLQKAVTHSAAYFGVERTGPEAERTEGERTKRTKEEGINRSTPINIPVRDAQHTAPSLRSGPSTPTTCVQSPVSLGSGYATPCPVDRSSSDGLFSTRESLPTKENFNDTDNDTKDITDNSNNNTLRTKLTETTTLVLNTLNTVNRSTNKRAAVQGVVAELTSHVCQRGVESLVEMGGRLVLVESVRAVLSPKGTGETAGREDDGAPTQTGVCVDLQNEDTTAQKILDTPQHELSTPVQPGPGTLEIEQSIRLLNYGLSLLPTDPQLARPLTLHALDRLSSAVFSELDLPQPEPQHRPQSPIEQLVVTAVRCLALATQTALPFVTAAARALFATLFAVAVSVFGVLVAAEQQYGVLARVARGAAAAGRKAAASKRAKSMAEAFEGVVAAGAVAMAQAVVIVLAKPDETERRM